MKNEENINICYVFSQVTLDLAIDDWIKENKKSDSENHQKHLIAATAITWFLKHINNTNSINMFTHDDLLSEIQTWSSLQIAEFPQQEKRIEETCDLIISFFESEIVNQHKMTVKA